MGRRQRRRRSWKVLGRFGLYCLLSARQFAGSLAGGRAFSFLLGRFGRCIVNRQGAAGRVMTDGVVEFQPWVGNLRGDWPLDRARPRSRWNRFAAMVLRRSAAEGGAAPEAAAGVGLQCAERLWSLLSSACVLGCWHSWGRPHAVFFSWALRWARRQASRQARSGGACHSIKFRARPQFDRRHAGRRSKRATFK
jgi:hypothetical protein